MRISGRVANNCFIIARVFPVCFVLMSDDIPSADNPNIIDQESVLTRFPSLLIPDMRSTHELISPGRFVITANLDHGIIARTASIQSGNIAIISQRDIFRRASLMLFFQRRSPS